MTGPASGSPPGVSLAGPNGNGALVGATGPQPPTVAPQPVNRGASGPGFGVGGGWRNPFTSPHVDPTTGQPEMLNGPGGLVAKSRGALNPFGFIGGGNPYWRGAIAAGGILSPTPAETGEMPRQTLGRRPSGPVAPAPGGIGSDANFPVSGAAGFPNTYAPPGQQPAMPNPAAAPVPGAVGSPAPAMPPPRPRMTVPAARTPAPAAAAAGPPPGMVARPNADVAGGARGRQSVPYMSALDLSKLFQRGQPQ